jgi:hypothetical protein
MSQKNSKQHKYIDSRVESTFGVLFQSMIANANDTAKTNDKTNDNDYNTNLFVCPFTKSNIIIAGITEVGQIYEYDYIMTWLEMRCFDPVTNAKVEASKVVRIELNCDTAVSKAIKLIDQLRYNYRSKVKSYDQFISRNVIRDDIVKKIESKKELIDILKQSNDGVYNNFQKDLLRLLRNETKIKYFYDNFECQRKVIIADVDGFTFLSHQPDRLERIHNNNYKCVNFTCVELYNIIFTNCSFHNSNFILSTVNNCTFVNCEFTGEPVSFYKSRFTNCQFINCKTEQANWKQIYVKRSDEVIETFIERAMECKFEILDDTAFMCI